MQLERISVENGFEKKGNWRTTTSKHCRQQQPYDVGSGGKRGGKGVVRKLRLLFLGALKILTTWKSLFFYLEKDLLLQNECHDTHDHVH
jgi:hypothetical protein